MSLRKAAQQALDALEEYEKSYQAVADGLKPLRAALAENQSEDVLGMVEPVAWLTRDEQDGLWHPTALKKTVDDRPLYLAPPKREPLTDEEISKIFIYCGRDKETFARAIERAHGIGGEE